MLGLAWCVAPPLVEGRVFNEMICFDPGLGVRSEETLCLGGGKEEYQDAEGGPANFSFSTKK